MSKNKKSQSNMNLTNILSPISHTKNHSSGSPFNITKKNSCKTNCERLKKENSSNKIKNRLKNSEVMINNYLSQRSRLNTDGNELNLKKLKFSYNFLRNKIEQGFKNNNNKKIMAKSNNFDNINNNFRVTKKIQNSKKSESNNKNYNTNGHVNRLIGRSTNKKIIDENSHNYEYNNTNNTNIHNRSNTQTYFRQSNKKIINNNKTQKPTSHSNKNRKVNKSEDMKKRKVNNRITKENKIGALRQMSPLYISNNKLSNIQNYFRNITNNKNILNSNKARQKNNNNNNERQILITEPKEFNNKNKIQSDDFIVKKNNSSYLVISKKPAQITNFIEKKENNKYINNYFNICDNKKGENDDDKINKNSYSTFEEIHFFFVKQIQTGNKLNIYMGCHNS